MKEGWGNPEPFNSRAKFHYFVENRSLCGRWAWLGGSENLETGKDDHADNCAACKKAKSRLTMDKRVTPVLERAIKRFAKDEKLYTVGSPHISEKSVDALHELGFFVDGESVHGAAHEDGNLYWAYDLEKFRARAVELGVILDA